MIFFFFLPAHMAVHYVCTRPKKVRSHGTGVRDGREAPCGSWNLRLGPPVLRSSARIARALSCWLIALPPGSVFFIINILKAFFFLLQLYSLCQTILGFALLFCSLISFPHVARVPPVDCLSWRSHRSALAHSSAWCALTRVFGPLHRTHCSAGFISSSWLVPAPSLSTVGFQHTIKMKTPSDDNRKSGEQRALRGTLGQKCTMKFRTQWNENEF